MKFTINNRFRAVLGCLLAVGLFFSTPSLAFQEDSLAQDAQVSTATETVEEGTASPAATEEVADTVSATGEEASAATTTSTTTSSSSSSASAVDEGTQIEPHVYK